MTSGRLGRCVAWSSFVATIASIALCAGCTIVEPTEGGPAALSAAAASLSTYSPAAWSSRCASGLGDPRLCRALAGSRTAAQRERVALQLNVAASPALASMHFTHGVRITWSVADILRRSSNTADPAVTRAMSDANTAFAEGVDRQVLDTWVTTPICGQPDAVDGLASARCVALDAECRRGEFDAAHGCCGEWDLPAAMICGEALSDSSDRDDHDDHDDHDEHHGGDTDARRDCSDREDTHDGRGHHAAALMCDGRGGCVDPRTVPQEIRARGVFTWVEGVRSDSAIPPTPSLWYTAPESSVSPIELSLDGAPVATVPASQAGHRTRLAVSPPGSLGVAAVDLGPNTATTVRSIFVPRRISVNLDLDHGDTYEVCASAGSFDSLPTLIGECQGDARVTCPSPPGAPITCTIDARGFSVLTAPGLSIAWERDQSRPLNAAAPAAPAAPPVPPPHDAGTDAAVPPNTAVRDPALVARLFIFQPIRLLGPPHVLSADAGITIIPVHIWPPGPGGSCGPPISCAAACGSGERLCFNGHYGACTTIGTLETCNGVDDDCDGSIDEEADASCDDGVPCSADVCVRPRTIPCGTRPGCDSVVSRGIRPRRDHARS